MENITTKQVLEHLEECGWTDIIDSIYERAVTKDIIEKFPNISREVLDRVLEDILI